MKKKKLWKADFKKLIAFNEDNPKEIKKFKNEEELLIFEIENTNVDRILDRLEFENSSLNE